MPAVAPSARSTRLDFGGAGIAATGMLMLVYPLVQGRELGWPAWVLRDARRLAPGARRSPSKLRRKRAGAPTWSSRPCSRDADTSPASLSVFFFGAMGGIMLTLGILLQVGLG